MMPRKYISKSDIEDVLCASETMRHTIDKHIRYWELAGIEYKHIIENKLLDHLSHGDGAKNFFITDIDSPYDLRCTGKVEGRKLWKDICESVFLEAGDHLPFTDRVLPTEDGKTHGRAAGDGLIGQVSPHSVDMRNIYIENALRGDKITEDMLSNIFHISGCDDKSDFTCDPEKTNDISVKYIDNYSDLLEHVPGMIFAKRRGRCIYPGAPVCQDFDEKYFYYTTSVANCIYDCEYCFLKGMYGVRDIIIYTDIYDVMDEVRELLSSHPVYLCISYDSDLIALEDITHCVSRWADMAADEPDLMIECRTKCARRDIWHRLLPVSGMIYAFTLSPNEIIDAYERGTSSLVSRLRSIKSAMDNGHTVRLCFDPMIYTTGWKKYYADMIDEVVHTIDMNKVRDISIGTFRISKAYIKKMRYTYPCSTIAQFPYETEKGYCRYPHYIKDEMETYLTDMLKGVVDKNKIYRL